MTLEDKIRYALKDYEPAVRCFFLLRDILHFWDDLIDKDKPISDEYINTSMFSAVVRLPADPFFRKYQESLLPIVVNAVANWHTANRFEREGNPDELELAFVIRSDYANILIHMAFIVGGYDWMLEVTPTIRSMWTSENFDKYMENLARERASRGQ